ncbi:lysophospholipid acyltransferase family protein [Scatolibacter rhodanostii]|uniref:lysophospholipid acyltransferase family protein n=1 Tax=Scatolibacter rhodanostii TaxID=2014781 RepID=UPI000C0748DC|nr:lysophospholipid acyltransferase family protein [Scatolibacter rhodanostii]
MKKTALYRFAQIIVPAIFKILYRYKIVGKENIPQTGKLLMCSNHTSNADPLFLGLTQKRQVWFMAKQELFKNKFLAGIIRGLGAFPVERSGGVSAIKKGIDLLKKENVVGIFIEGTRSKTGELLKPKPGVTLLAYETKATIVPMAIVGKDGKPPKAFQKTIINIGKPMPFEDLGMEDSSGLAMRNASRTVMEEIRILREEAIKMQQKGE